MKEVAENYPKRVIYEPVMCNYVNVTRRCGSCFNDFCFQFILMIFVSIFTASDEKRHREVLSYIYNKTRYYARACQKVYYWTKAGADSVPPVCSTYTYTSNPPLANVHGELNLSFAYFTIRTLLSCLCIAFFRSFSQTGLRRWNIGRMINIRVHTFNI